MKLTTSLLATTLALTQTATAHYFFDVLVVDGQETKPLQYVRENTRQAKYNPTKWKNTRDDMTPDLTDFRCNKGAFQSAGRTQTAEVKAGSKLAMKLAVGATMQHPGPQIVYMSKAPGAVNKYEGEGDWFKIMESGVCDKTKDFTKEAWCSWDKDRIEFTIPLDTPDGEYLIRPEHIALHGAHDGQAEFYYGCAQVKVTGGGNGVPSPTAKIPGVYKVNDPEVNFSLWGGYKDYTMPGPALWTGGGSAPGGGNSSSTAPAPGNSSSAAPAPENPSSTAPAAGSSSSAAPAAGNSPSASPAPAPAPIGSGYATGDEFPPFPFPSSTSGAPVAGPVASAAAVHTDENCNKGKLARTRRAFREMLQKL